MLWKAAERSPSAYSLSPGVSPGCCVSQAPPLQYPALLSRGVPWSCSSWTCGPVHLSSGFYNWKQACWASWPFPAHTSPHHHHHISQGRNHGNCWNLVSGYSPVFSKTVWFGIHMFPERLLCALLAYSFFQNADKACISSKRSSGMHNLMWLFIQLSISFLETPVLLGPKIGARDTHR